MSLAISPITQKKLVLVRQLYQSAVIQASSRYSPVSRIMATIGFDLSVETALKAVVAALDTNDQPEKTFESIIQQVNSKLQKSGLPSIPDEANIRHVHSVRNDAQHKAKYPTESDITDCKIYVKDFLDKLLTQIWGIGFESISLVDLVQNKIAKKHLSRAEKVLDQGDYEETIRRANTALAWATWNIRQRVFGGQVDISEEFDFSNYQDSIDETLSDAINSAFEPVRTEISRELDSMQEALLSISVGMNYAQFVRLKMLLLDEVVDFDQNGEAFYQRSLFKVIVSEDDAQFALNYCIDAILQIEAQIGDLEERITPKWGVS